MAKGFYVALIFIFVTFLVFSLHTKVCIDYNVSIFKHKLFIIADIFALVSPFLYLAYKDYSERKQKIGESTEDFNRRQTENNNKANTFYWSSIICIILAYFFMILCYKFEI